MSLDKKVVENLPVVILAGGYGMRLRDYSELLPKPLIEIGNIPIIHHVMKIYAHAGFNKFIVCLGYKGDLVKEYFYNLHLKKDAVRILTKNGKIINFGEKVDDFDITFVNTGADTPTGGAIKKLEPYIKTKTFLATYSDGVADINIKDLLNYHFSKNKMATVTTITPTSPFGILEVKDGAVKTFKEKPKLAGLINGGFFVFNKKFFDYLKNDSVLEEEPLRAVTKDNQLSAYLHNGFWASMDTAKDVARLNSLWKDGYYPHVGVQLKKAPWKVW